jgi:hypothetical protein
MCAVLLYTVLCCAMLCCTVLCSVVGKCVLLLSRIDQRSRTAISSLIAEIRKTRVVHPDLLFSASISSLTLIERLISYSSPSQHHIEIRREIRSSCPVD